MCLAMVSLSWWLWAVSENDESLEDVLSAVLEIAWVLWLVVNLLGTGKKHSLASEDAAGLDPCKCAHFE